MACSRENFTFTFTPKENCNTHVVLGQEVEEATTEFQQEVSGAVT
jgi:hypothetical protein